MTIFSPPTNFNILNERKDKKFQILKIWVAQSRISMHLKMEGNASSGSNNIAKSL